MNHIYNLLVDDGDQSLSWEFADRERAITEAQKHWYNGAFSVRVCHYTNGGANCIDDYYRTQD